MGLITSRFRSNVSTIEVLETIEKDISRLQRCRRENQQMQKKVAASLLLYSIILYIIGAVLFYFLYFPEKWQDRALYSIPLLVFPLLVWIARKLLHWYFVKRLTANDLAVNELREKKKLILEDVMEKETYKKAREILEKFDPARFKKLEQKTESPTVVVASPSGVRQRVVQQPTPQRGVTPRMVRPMASHPSSALPRPQWGSGVRPSPGMPLRPPMAIPAMSYSPPPGPPMPRTVLPKDRGVMDKFIDYMVGDGPQNRFALVCRFCHCHNGMALPEEFEYLSFRCCYCYNMNQARKMRPFAPRLEFPEVPSQNKSSAQSSDAESDKEADTSSNKGDAEDGAPHKSEDTKATAADSTPPTAAATQPEADHLDNHFSEQTAATDGPPPLEEEAESKPEADKKVD